MAFLRRKQKRESVSQHCKVESSSGNWSCSGRVLNLSEVGAGLDLNDELHDRGELILYMTDENGRELVKKGFVIWYFNKMPPDTGSTVGLKFT
ncbi:MAG: PilZ domain-containing protein [Deltaproteobacteria bacterium]|nr:PilZ domain-containing protein [Deltaproteobacteria bacterium]